MPSGRGNGVAEEQGVGGTNHQSERATFFWCILLGAAGGQSKGAGVTCLPIPCPLLAPPMHTQWNSKKRENKREKCQCNQWFEDSFGRYNNSIILRKWYSGPERKIEHKLIAWCGLYGVVHVFVVAEDCESSDCWGCSDCHEEEDKDGEAVFCLRYLISRLFLITV